jgi:hypothetical protein
MTHRCFSRNAASSRAIPISKLIDAVANNPAAFEFWGENQAGMQAMLEMAPHDKMLAEEAWSFCTQLALTGAKRFAATGAHKQMVNRSIENHGHITVIATTNKRGLDNFFSQRANKHAQPEFQVLAYRMLEQYLGVAAEIIEPGQWYIPFGDEEEFKSGFWPIEKQVAAATGRIARVSYLNHDGTKATFEDDLKLHDRLMSSGHWSPFEHCAMAVDSKTEIASNRPSNLGAGWLQYRKMFKDQPEPRELDLHKMLENRPAWVKLERDLA